MYYLLLAYITAFSLGFAVLFVVELTVTAPEERDPPLETFLDISLGWTHTPEGCKRNIVRTKVRE